MATCTSAGGCDDTAVRRISILAPTGETITTDTGTDPVLAQVLTGDLCDFHSAGIAYLGDLIAATGGHVDMLDLDPAPDRDLDALQQAYRDHEDDLGYGAVLA